MQTNEKNNLDRKAKDAAKWLRSWLNAEEGALEREMAAAQQQAAASDEPEVDLAELRWAREEKEEEKGRRKEREKGKGGRRRGEEGGGL